MSTNSNLYETALSLAESGEYQQALDKFSEYLSSNPGDGQAWNDTGAVLFCMGQNDKAIEHFKKAREILGVTRDSAEVIWNLCEASISARRPGEAVGCIGDLDNLGILNPDVLNRLANCFLENNDLAGGVEMMLKSLEMAEEQDILTPMIEVVRSKRAKVAVVCENETEQMHRLMDYLDRRYPVKLYSWGQMEQFRFEQDQSDVIWFEGCNSQTAGIINGLGDKKVVLNLNAVNGPSQWLGMVDAEKVDIFVLPGDKAIQSEILNVVGDVRNKSFAADVSGGVDVESFRLSDKSIGKNIVCLGDFDHENNPVVLLLCMQKLNFIDSGYHLYLAGDFREASVENTVRHIISSNGLSEKVTIEALPRDLNAWLADKHYVASSSTGAAGLEKVQAAMACGLKPVVFNTPAACERFGEEYLFNIAEHFCREITQGSFEPKKYRQAVEGRFNNKSMFMLVNGIIIGLEKDVLEKKQNEGPVHEQTNTQEVSVSSGASVGQSGTVSRQRRKAIPIEHVDPLDNKDQIPMKVNTAMQEQFQSSKAGRAAREASEALRQVIRKKANQSEPWNEQNSAVESQLGGSASLDDSIRENRVKSSASEFAGKTNPFREALRKLENTNA